MTLEDFERRVMDALLWGNDPLLESLRAQYAAASVRGRELTASGFVTRFEVPPSVPAIDRRLLHLDDLHVALTGADTPCETSLQVRKGRLSTLDCSLYEGSFPENPEITEAWFYGTERYPDITPELLAERDFEELLEDDD